MPQHITIEKFIAHLGGTWGDASTPDFEQTMEVINSNYNYTPSRFFNGKTPDTVVNEAGTNEGSCKIFFFAKLNQLNDEQTLACFGRFYYDDVLKHPESDDHGNIRNFIKYGREGIQFDQVALQLK